MKHNSCSDIKISTHSACEPNIKSNLKKVFFNPDTKEVFDEYSNFIGVGEYDNGVLKITRDDDDRSRTK